MSAQVLQGGAEALLDQWPDALADLDGREEELVVSMLDSMASGADVRVTATETGDCEWRVGVHLADRLGVLSLVSGLFTSCGLDIRRADTFTVAIPVDQSRMERHADVRMRRHRMRGSARRRRPPEFTRPLFRCAVMLFHLSADSRHRPDWRAIEDDLKALLDEARTGGLDSAHSSLIDRFADTMRDAQQQARGPIPITISTSSSTSPQHTVLTILSEDTPGFLFAFTTAISSLRINVVRARIRTEDERVTDTFWFTDATERGIESEDRLRHIRAAAALIKQFTHLLPISPDPGQALRQFTALTGQLLSKPDQTTTLQSLESPGVLETLAELLGMSRFLWEDFLRMQHDNLFPLLLDVEALDSGRSGDQLSTTLDRDIESQDDHDQRVRALNDFKDREMFRADLRYITGRIDLREFGEELSTLAEVVVRAAFDLSIDSVAERFGVPRLADGSECAWGIFALGKFGGKELGFGSDIELTFVYQEEGTTDGRNSVRSSTFFDEVVKEFLRVLETRHQGIFEVDTRLRPYGSKGALASSLGSFADYYTEAGDAKQFERLALVRMRHVAGDSDLAERVKRIQESFVYSSIALDFENIRHMRRRQSNELVSRDAVNAKLSPGGLVDIEYYVQTWQIAAGDVDHSVRVTNTLDAVGSLHSGGHLTESQAGKVRRAYSLMRELIDALRVVRGNAKDLDIPPAESREFYYLAHRLGIDRSSELDALIREQMELSQRLWDELPR